MNTACVAALPRAGATWLLQSQVLACSQAKTRFGESTLLPSTLRDAAFPLHAIEGADLRWVGAVSRGTGAWQSPDSRGL